MDLNSNKQQAKKKNLKEGPAHEGTWKTDMELSEYPASVRSSGTASHQEPQQSSHQGLKQHSPLMWEAGAPWRSLAALVIASRNDLMGFNSRSWFGRSITHISSIWCEVQRSLTEQLILSHCTTHSSRDTTVLLQNQLTVKHILLLLCIFEPNSPPSTKLR